MGVAHGRQARLGLGPGRRPRGRARAGRQRHGPARAGREGGIAWHTTREEIAAIHLEQWRLTLRTHRGPRVPMVVARYASVRDRELARELAHQLGVPFVEDTGMGDALPPMRARRRLTP